MSETPMKLIIDLSKPEGQRESYVPLTAEEIAQRDLDAQQAEAERLAREEEQARIDDLKQSARAKLIAGQPLTEEEAALLVI